MAAFIDTVFARQRLKIKDRTAGFLWFDRDLHWPETILLAVTGHKLFTIQQKHTIADIESM